MSGVNFRKNSKNMNSLAALVPLIDGAKVVNAPHDGIMVYSFATAQAGMMYREVRSSATDSIYIAGGPHPSARPKECLGYFDYVVVGEGEEALPGLIDRLRAGAPVDVKGIAYMEGDDFVFTGHGPYVDLDRFPPFQKEISLGHIEISRGCPHGCTYCQTPRLFGSQMRHRSPQAAARYAGMLKDVRFISPNAFAYGSNGGHPEPDRIQALLEAVPPGRRIFFGTFPSEVRPEFVTEEILELVREHCHNRTLSLGAQSGSQAVLDRIRRGHTVEDVRNAVALCREYGLKPIVDIIFGLPQESSSEQQETLSLVKWIAENGGRIHSHYFIPLPGTPLEHSAPSSIDPCVNRTMGKLARDGSVTGVWGPGVPGR